MSKKTFLFSILFLGMVINSHSQNFEWVKSFGGTGAENNPLCVQTKDGSYLTWIGYNNTSFGSFNKTISRGAIACIGKLDNSGKPLWLWAPDSIIAAINFNAITTDSISENIYISGQIEGNIYFGNQNFSSFYSKSKKKYTRNAFILKLNKNGTQPKILILKDTNNSDINDIKLNENKIFVPISFNASVNKKFCALNSSSYENSGIIISCLDTNLKNINKSQ